MPTIAMPPGLDPEQRLAWLKIRQELADTERRVKVARWRNRPDAWYCDRTECDGKPHDRWKAKHCRRIPGRSQAPPKGKWRIRFIRGGRGSGKTKSASENFADLIISSEPGEWAVVGPTFGDARDVCMAGPSGLIVALGGRAGPGGTLIERGPWIAKNGWNVSTGQLRLENGSIVYCDGANDGADRVQGKNLRGAWCDEVGLWAGSNRRGQKPKWTIAWDESIKYAVRLSPAKIIASGTPKESRSAKALVQRLLNDPKVPVDRLRTEDNADNLDPDQLSDWLESKGTRLGQQELEGELLTDREGALVTWDDIIPHRVAEDDVPPLSRILVSIDPSFSNTENSDECGIVAVGRGAGKWSGHAYVLSDWSGRYSMDTWAKKAVLLAWMLSANGIVYESNLAGDVVKRNIEGAISDLLTNESAWLSADVAEAGVDGKPENWVPPRLIKATAKMPKEARLEVVAPLWQQHRVHHVMLVEPDGSQILQDALEGQLTSWSPEDSYSPDRLDACSQAVAELNIQQFRRRAAATGDMLQRIGGQG